MTKYSVTFSIEPMDGTPATVEHIVIEAEPHVIIDLQTELSDIIQCLKTTAT